ncbi:uncharacterized protein LOC124113522 [Haliotis rufescens]|uniref:uncharacterized protein LOC124113522 n=1 Tax=Haliotis rufescens TaxID=6454 RepID=UPI00201EE498|nr:uncharacterized protein LOC124113522 [Haliotis rufescens]
MPRTPSQRANTQTFPIQKAPVHVGQASYGRTTLTSSYTKRPNKSNTSPKLSAIKTHASNYIQGPKASGHVAPQRKISEQSRTSIYRAQQPNYVHKQVLPSTNRWTWQAAQRAPSVRQQASPLKNMMNPSHKSGGFGVSGNMVLPPSPLGSLLQYASNTSHPQQAASATRSPSPLDFMMRLIEVVSRIKAARSLDCKTVPELMGLDHLALFPMSCDDRCPPMMTCRKAGHVAFCCPLPVTDNLIRVKAYAERMELLVNQ